MQINKYGLSRTIPPEVELEVRQRCGFGCVICGAALYDFEHFDPPFSEACAHDAAGITLLCMQHNQAKNRKHLSVETVRTANVRPKCLQDGFASYAFDYGSGPIDVVFGGLTVSDCRYLISVNKTPIFSVESPQFPGAPFQLSGIFTDPAGRATLRIENNRWYVDQGNWDVACDGPRIKIRRKRRDVVLILKTEPPSRLIVERLEMSYQGVQISLIGNAFKFKLPNKPWTEFRQVQITSFETALAIET